jgi:hypothetical protein
MQPNDCAKFFFEGGIFQAGEIKVGTKKKGKKGACLKYF